MSHVTCKGIIFDLDGVVTATAKVHALAWEETFNAFLHEEARRDKKRYVPFDRKDDYLEYVDGKPRVEGVKSFLASRGYDLPWGSPGDAPDARTLCGVGNRKNELFQEILRREGPEVFPGSLLFIQALKDRGIKTAVASSSRNCVLVLELAGLADMFQARVDGEVSAKRGLKGKPDPDIFVEAARDLGLTPGECAVVEDAISGVQAGRAGNFGLVLGVARNVEGGLLKRFGADIVVNDLGEVSLADVEAWFATGLDRDGWELRYDGFDPGDEKLRETLCTVGNGYLGTRGCFPGEKASFTFYPGTYIAGVYNRIPTSIHGRDVFNNDFVNCPNWLALTFRIGASAYASPLSMELLHCTRTLSMRDGTTEWTILCRDKLGRVTRVQPRIMASMANPHLCALTYAITPCNYTEPITVRASLDGNVINDGVPRYRELDQTHLEGVAAGPDNGGVFLHMRTNASGYGIAMCATSRLRRAGRRVAVDRRVAQEEWNIIEEFTFLAEENVTWTVEKLVAVHTSLDAAGGDPVAAARASLAGAGSVAHVYAAHARAWSRLWDTADIVVRGDRFVQRTARLHIYHLLVTASPHNVRIDAGMPARGLHGEAYRGHIFWDELYIFPFYDQRFFRITRALLMYRVRRLDAARDYAGANGYAGAMYPWQSCDTGREETQEVHFNPESGEWGPDYSCIQRHVSIGVFLNAWRYVQWSGDARFLHAHGAAMMLEIARFWASIATRDAATGRYSIAGVMGPDEFHEALPGAKEHGIKDNAYTNIMVAWLMDKAVELVGVLPRGVLVRLGKEIGFAAEETSLWRDMAANMRVLITPQGVLHQFDGYMGLKELDWAAYRKRYYSIHRLDRILKAESDTPDNYKVAKQADALMPFYVLEPEEVCAILMRLGHDVGDPGEFLRRNYAFYEPRTSHGSTLSKVVHAVVASEFGSTDTAWEWFTEAMRSDVFDIQGGTTVEGIHTGVMAGTLDIMVRTFAGVRFKDGVLHVSPRLPGHWKALSFTLWRAGAHYAFTFEGQSVRLRVKSESGASVTGYISGSTMLLESEREYTFDLA